jgi:membrane protein YdbS with pleckstrin-like domain
MSASVEDELQHHHHKLYNNLYTMINNEIIDYIKSELARGQNTEEIRTALVESGWKESDILEAFNSLSTPVTSSINTEAPQHASVLVTEKEYPITNLWIFKGPIIALVVSVVALFFGVWIPYLVIAAPIWLISNPLIKSRFHYSTGEKFFDVEQGVFSKKQRHLPYGVIQNVIVKQDWFDRVFGLATLAIEDASQGGGKGLFGGSSFRLSGNTQQQDTSLGSSGNRVNIPGLKKEDAETLKLIILQRMKENPVEELGL